MNDDGLFDLAEIRAEQEREAAIHRAATALKQVGSDDCEDCGVKILEKRRIAIPSTKRCAPCQNSYEAGLKAR